MINIYVGKKIFSATNYIFIESKKDDIYIQLENPMEVKFPDYSVKKEDIRKIIQFLQESIKEEDKNETSNL